MGDVNLPTTQDANVTPDVTPGEVTPQAATPQPNQTPSGEPVVPATPQTPAERTIPYSRFSEVNKERNELKRQLAEFQRNQQLGQYNPDDVTAILQHPIVQDLLIKDAKRVVTDYAKEYMAQYPKFPEAVKRAILTNVRGFIKESTTDPESAKLDVAEYIDSVMAEMEQQPNGPKTFTVASTNAPGISSPTRPADVEKILHKPIDEWSDEETKVVEDYTKSLPKK